MMAKVGYPRENVKTYTPICPECGAESERSFEVSEIAERWLVAHVSGWHPEEADFITAQLVRHGFGGKRATESAPAESPPAPVPTPRRLVRRKPTRKKPVAGSDPYLGAP